MDSPALGNLTVQQWISRGEQGLPVAMEVQPLVNALLPVKDEVKPEAWEWINENLALVRG